jgi:hypothetical protein
MVNDALIALDKDTRPHMYKADILTQTHDSATVQYPDHDWKDCAKFAMDFNKHMSPQLKCKGREFTIKTDLKVGFDWGHMTELKLEGMKAKDLADAIKTACDKLRQ